MVHACDVPLCETIHSVSGVPIWKVSFGLMFPSAASTRHFRFLFTVCVFCDVYFHSRWSAMVPKSMNSPYTFARPRSRDLPKCLLCAIQKDRCQETADAYHFCGRPPAQEPHADPPDSPITVGRFWEINNELTAVKVLEEILSIDVKSGRTMLQILAETWT